MLSPYHVQPSHRPHPLESLTMACRIGLYFDFDIAVTVDAMSLSVDALTSHRMIVPQI